MNKYFKCDAEDKDTGAPFFAILKTSHNVLNEEEMTLVDFYGYSENLILECIEKKEVLNDWCVLKKVVQENTDLYQLI